MFLSVFIIATTLVVMFVLWSRKVQGSITWRAMTTPLASIIGSGFLVLGPILDHAYGKYAPLVMLGLCIGAYLFGSAIRFNMTVIASKPVERSELVEHLETAASWSLSLAYLISVAYYLNLFGAFGVSLTTVDHPINAKLLTSAVFFVILFVGWTRGFKALENMEYVSVTLKLAVICGLLVGLVWYFGSRMADHGLILNLPKLTGWSAIALSFGLIVTVQGFETSRYLGADYDVGTRTRSMRWAQWVSTLIYMSYIFLVAYVFERGDLKLTETAIVGMMQVVAPILPVLLVAAALAAQFSAAVADTSGAGGLFVEVSGNRMSARQAYALLTLIGLFLTWSSDVFQIISYASRAFALYYALQSLIAAISAWDTVEQKKKSVGFFMLAVLGLMIAFFGKAVEA